MKKDDIGCVLIGLICVVGFIALAIVEDRRQIREDELFFENCSEWHKDWASNNVCDKFRDNPK